MWRVLIGGDAEAGEPSGGVVDRGDEAEGDGLGAVVVVDGGALLLECEDAGCGLPVVYVGGGFDGVADPIKAVAVACGSGGVARAEGFEAAIGKKEVAGVCLIPRQVGECVA